jgi:pilus assembly protein Flp/PilA
MNANLLSNKLPPDADAGESGQGMIEYGLLVALISIAAIAVIVLIGPQITTIFGNVFNAL